MENQDTLCLLYSACINIIVSLCSCRKITNNFLSAKYFTHFLHFHPILRLTLRHWHALPFTDAGTQVHRYARTFVSASAPERASPPAQGDVSTHTRGSAYTKGARTYAAHNTLQQPDTMDKETKKRIWSWAVQTLIAALTALATALGITSGIGL